VRSESRPVAEQGVRVAWAADADGGRPADAAAPARHQRDVAANLGLDSMLIRAFLPVSAA